MLSIRVPTLRAVAARPATAGWPFAVVLVLAIFAGLRMVYAGCVEPDEADLILFGQQLAWGYSEQPPLYSWLCAAAFELFGTGVAALVAVRTLVLATTVGLLYATARIAVPDRRLAILATFSVLLVPSLAWHSLTYLTHSILAFLAGVAALHACLRIVRDGQTRDYVYLGIACAAGVLSKYNFALFAFALLLAGMSLAPSRRRLLDLRMGLTIATFAILVAPHAWWVFEHREIIRAELLVKVTHDRNRDADRIVRSLIGIKEIVQNGLLAAGPLALAVWLVFRRGSSEETASIAPFARIFLGRFLLLAVGLLFAMVLANGWDRFHERWLMPFTLVLPLWLFARIDPDAIRPKQIRIYSILLAVLALSYGGVRTIQVSFFLDRTGGLYPLRLDFTELAKAIEAEAGSRPLILTKQREVGGNLRLAMPGARVLCCYGNLHDLPPTGGPIVIAWNPNLSNDKPEVPWPWLKRFWDIAPPSHVPPESVKTVQVAASGPNGRPASVMFVVFKTPERPPVPGTP